MCQCVNVRFCSSTAVYHSGRRCGRGALSPQTVRPTWRDLPQSTRQRCGPPPVEVTCSWTNCLCIIQSSFIAGAAMEYTYLHTPYVLQLFDFTRAARARVSWTCHFSSHALTQELGIRWGLRTHRPSFFHLLKLHFSQAGLDVIRRHMREARL